MVRRVALLGGALGLAMVGMGLAATPAFAPTFTTCSSGSGTASASPGWSATPATQQISSSGTISGCTGGGVSSGTTTASLTTTTAQTCAALTSPPVAGTVLATGTFSIRWNTGAMSSGVAKIKSRAVGDVKFIGKITSGLFFTTTPTKGKVFIHFLPAP